MTPNIMSDLFPVANLAHYAEPLAASFVAALWQSIALCLAASLFLRLTPRIAASHRFAVWTACFIAVVALPFLPIIGTHTLEASTAFLAPASGAPTTAWLEFDTHWALAIVALWLFASVVSAVSLVQQAFRLRSLWKTAQPVSDIEPIFAPLNRTFEICSTSELDRPSVIGFFSPRILIPSWLLARLTPAELRQIVLHEAEHLRRRDDWTNLVQKLALVFFPLNPALWFIDRRLSAAREMACDEGVIRITQAPRAYAACLTRLAERGLHHRREALSLGAWQRRPELVGRVHSILRGKTMLHPIAAHALLGVAACGMLVASLEIARCPQLVTFVSRQPSLQLEASNRLTATPHHLLSVGVSGDAQDANDPGAEHMSPAKHTVPAASSPKPRPSEPGASRPSGVPSQHSSHHDTDAVQYHSQLASLRSEAQPAAPHEFMFLTTWEQVETRRDPQVTAAAEPQPSLSARSSLSADYDNTPAPTGQTNGRHVTVTRLIVRFASPDLHTAQPAAIPIGNGWFVIQL